MVQSVVGSVGDVFEPGHLGELTQVVPPELVDAILEETGARERRLRCLPSRVEVYFVLALGLFAHLPALPLDPPQPADTHRTEHLQDHPARHLDTTPRPLTSRHWVITAHTQLRLGRPLVEDLRRPWERPAEPGRLTPARVRRGFRNLRPALPCPARAPTPTRPGLGRPLGSKNRRPATRYDVGKTPGTPRGQFRPEHGGS